MSAQVEWFYVLTLEWPGYNMSTRSGTLTPNEGTTRAQVFTEIFRSVADQMVRPPGATGDPNVLLWSFEPNQL